MQWYDADTLLSLLLPQNVTAVFAFYWNIASDLTDDARVCELELLCDSKTTRSWIHDFFASSRPSVLQ